MNAYFMSLQQTKYQHNLPNTKLVVSIEVAGFGITVDAPPTQNTEMLGAKVVSNERNTSKTRGPKQGSRNIVYDTATLIIILRTGHPCACFSTL